MYDFFIKNDFYREFLQHKKIKTIITTELH